MLELLIAISYVAFGIALFKIDIDHNISGILFVGCFNGQGFNLLFIFYAALSPIVLISIVLHQIKLLSKTLKKINL